MSSPMGIHKIVQLAVALDAEGNESLYALDRYGRIFEHCNGSQPKVYGRAAGATYQGDVTLAEDKVFYAGTTAGWREVSMDLSVPLYHKEDPRHGLPKE